MKEGLVGWLVGWGGGSRRVLMGFWRLGGLKRKLYPLIFPPVHKEERVQSGFNHILIIRFICIENVEHSGRINKGGKCIQANYSDICDVIKG